MGRAPPHGDDLDGPDIDVSTEGCAVAFFRLRDCLKSHGDVAWTWNDESERWERVALHELRPGMVVMLHREAGGYNTHFGWTGDKQHVLTDVPQAGRGRSLRDDERTEAGYWSQLDVHLKDTREKAEELCEGVGLYNNDERLRALRISVIEAAALHDLGKAHPRWQKALPAATALTGGPWAKCPRVLAIDATSNDEVIRNAVLKLRPDVLALGVVRRRKGREDLVRLQWAVGQKLRREEIESLKSCNGVRWVGHVPFRPGLRHEAASALAMWRRYREGGATYPALSVYLAAAHHGKVRTVLRSTASEGDDVFGMPRVPDVVELFGEQWPLDFSVAKDGADGQWMDGKFMLTNYGWTGLVSDLLGPWCADDHADVGAVPSQEPRGLGPFVLAYLEALVRIADWRASESPSQSTAPAEIARER